MKLRTAAAIREVLDDTRTAKDIARLGLDLPDFASFIANPPKDALSKSLSATLWAQMSVLSTTHDHCVIVFAHELNGIIAISRESFRTMLATKGWTRSLPLVFQVQASKLTGLLLIPSRSLFVDRSKLSIETFASWISTSPAPSSVTGVPARVNFVYGGNRNGPTFENIGLACRSEFFNKHQFSEFHSLPVLFDVLVQLCFMQFDLMPGLWDSIWGKCPEYLMKRVNAFAGCEVMCGLLRNGLSLWPASHV